MVGVLSISKGYKMFSRDQKRRSRVASLKAHVPSARDLMIPEFDCCVKQKFSLGSFMRNNLIFILGAVMLGLFITIIDWDKATGTKVPADNAKLTQRK